MLLRLGLWIAVAAAVVLAKGAPPAGPTFEELIFDKADFMKRLPEYTLLWPDPAKQPKAPATFGEVEAALKELGTVPGVQFFHAPPELTLPVIARFIRPEYPEKMLKKGEAGSAKFLVLINSAGNVTALYCFQCTNKEFAIAGAHCLVDWKFHPAVYNKTKVSILTVLPVQFAAVK
jgi:hypothetical protein